MKLSRREYRELRLSFNSIYDTFPNENLIIKTREIIKNLEKKNLLSSFFKFYVLRQKILNTRKALNLLYNKKLKVKKSTDIFETFNYLKQTRFRRINKFLMLKKYYTYLTLRKKVIKEYNKINNIYLPTIKPKVFQKRLKKKIKQRQLQELFNEARDINVLYITVKRNNMFAIFTENDGNTIVRCRNTGSFDLKVSKKSLKNNAEAFLRKYKRKMEKKNIKLANIVGIKLDCSRRSRRRMLKLLKKVFYPMLKKQKKNVLFDVPYTKSFNGCRGRSPKRKKRWRPKNHNLKYNI